MNRFMFALKNKTKLNIIENFERCYQDIVDYVNNHIGWELPECAQGAYNVWFNGKNVMVDVETSDGGVSSIVLEKFKKFVDEKGKVSEEDFCECFE